MNIFKKKSFLERNSTMNLAELIVEILGKTCDTQQGCVVGRRISFVMLMCEILIYQRDIEKKALGAKDFQQILELDYLINLVNSKKINNPKIVKDLKEYLFSLPTKIDSELKVFSANELSREQHIYITTDISKTIPVLILLNSRDY